MIVSMFISSIVSISSMIEEARQVLVRLPAVQDKDPHAPGCRNLMSAFEL